MGADVENIRKGRSRPTDIWELLQGGGAGDPDVLSRDLGNVPHDWEEPRHVTTKGGPPTVGYAPKEGHDGQVGIPTSG